MEESGSEGLDELIYAKKDTFFQVCFNQAQFKRQIFHVLYLIPS